MDWTLLELDSVDSTNEECKRRAAASPAPTRLAVTARQQTGGKGRRGRSFQSLRDKGLYLSVLFWPQAAPEELSALTAWTAVAVARAVERTAGIQADIKWPNDLQVGGRKLCGILTELGTDSQGRLFVVVGMGVNLTQTEADFGPELAPVAVSLAQLGAPVSREALLAALLEELTGLLEDFPHNFGPYLAAYRRRCVTLGKEVRLLGPTGEQDAVALDVDAHFALQVRCPDGTESTVTSGEVSVRNP